MGRSGRRPHRQRDRQVSRNVSVASHRRAARALVATIACVVTFVAAEAASRLLDGYQVSSLHLRASGVRTSRASSVARNSPDRRYAEAFPAVPPVRFSWYDQRPEPIPRIPLTPVLHQRADAYPTESWSP